MKHVDLEDCYLYNVLRLPWRAVFSDPTCPIYFGFVVLIPAGLGWGYTCAFGVN